jgi:DNA-binding beta-propeller fold protein YncE
VARGGPPFNRPTNLAVAASGDLYVTDGYGNARVHRFSAKGDLLSSWGEPGSGPGQFVTPHGIAVHRDGRVFVADRENDRIQIFSAIGEYEGEWTNVQRPTQLVFDAEGRCIVAELTWRAGQRSFRSGPIASHLPSRLSILDASGGVLARLGEAGPVDPTWGGPDPCRAGNFCAPHGLAIDSNGDLYVAEVTRTIGVVPGLVPEECHTFQKLALAR